MLQIASYELGKLLPENQRPLPLDLVRIGDSRSDVVPNGGEALLLMLLSFLHPAAYPEQFTTNPHDTDSQQRCQGNHVQYSLARPRLKPALIECARVGPSWSSTTSEAAVASVSEACKQLVKNLAPHTQVSPLS